MKMKYVRTQIFKICLEGSKKKKYLYKIYMKSLYINI